MTRKLDNLPELAAMAGLETAGIAPVRPAAALRERLQRRIAEGRTTPFEEQDTALRLAPEKLLPGCRSIIVVGMPHGGAAPDPPPGEGPGGEIARFARGPDYHRLLGARAEHLLELLQGELPGPLRGRILIDRNPLVERELAHSAGLGRIGENCNLITPAGGSHVALGTILLDRALETDPPLPQSCRQCGRCREACPTGALIEPYILDPRRCLSFVTQAPGIVPAAMRPLLGTRLYGCDRCQEVCPLNRPGGAAAGKGPLDGAGHLPARLPLLPLLEMSAREFDRTVGPTAAGWRGRTVLQRNTVIALGNSGDRGSIPALARLLQEDPRPLLRLHAAWALGRLGGAQARRRLEMQLSREGEPTVAGELRAALESAAP